MCFETSGNVLGKFPDLKMHPEMPDQVSEMFQPKQRVCFRLSAQTRHVSVPEKYFKGAWDLQ
jgi:hypothetical protein